MKRPVWAALGVVIVALAVPTAALATHNGSTHNLRHHGHGHGSIHRGATGSTGAKGANSVLSYIQGTLVLDLAGGGSVTGAVTDQTRFVCVGQGWGGQGGRNSGRNSGRKSGRLSRHFHSASTGSTGTTGSSGSTGSTGTTGSTGWTGSTGDRGYHGHGHGQGGGQGGGGSTPPPCDSSLLVPGALVSSADVLITQHGVLFAEINLLPAVQ